MMEESVLEKGWNEMNQLQLVTNVREDEKLRASFNELAQKIFGINFIEWYKKGYWSDKYVPFCYIDNDSVVANVSVNLLNLMIDGEKKKAIQIGTVMTDPAYRNRGLSRKLMEEVLKTYEGQYDIMYLFANDSVLHFYPKFGFQPSNEYLYSMRYEPKAIRTNTFKQLDGTNTEDLNFIYQFASNRIPVSERFSTLQTEELLMFYCLNVFTYDFYYSENKDVMVIFRHDNSELHIFDIISHHKINIELIINELASSETGNVIFHYTPEYESIKLEKTLYKGSEQLFIRLDKEMTLPSYVRHPQTAQA